MPQSLTLTVNVTEILLGAAAILTLVLLGMVALAWGFIRMSRSLNVLSEVTTRLTEKLEYFGGVLMEMVTRVKSLEARKGR